MLTRLFCSQELNKCKTELQYWRSKSTTLMSLPPVCVQCEAPIISVENEAAAAAGPPPPDGVLDEAAAVAAGVALIDTGVVVEPGANKPGASRSGPPSPAASSGRKRRSRDEPDSPLAAAAAMAGQAGDPEASGTRKSLRGNGVKGRAGKRLKMAGNSSQ